MSNAPLLLDSSRARIPSHPYTSTPSCPYGSQPLSNPSGGRFVLPSSFHTNLARMEPNSRESSLDSVSLNSERLSESSSTKSLNKLRLGIANLDVKKSIVGAWKGRGDGEENAELESLDTDLSTSSGGSSKGGRTSTASSVLVQDGHEEIGARSRSGGEWFRNQILVDGSPMIHEEGTGSGLVLVSEADMARILGVGGIGMGCLDRSLVKVPELNMPLMPTKKSKLQQIEQRGMEWWDD